MRTLLYKVVGQRLMPMGDHTGLIIGTEGYLQARFEFNMDWEGCKKVVSFYYNDDERAELIDENCTCMIPAEVLTNTTFKMRVEGRKQDYRILTNCIREEQSGGDI